MKNMTLDSQKLRSRIKDLDIEIAKLEKKLTEVIWERKKYKQFYSNSIKE